MPTRPSRSNRRSSSDSPLTQLQSVFDPFNSRLQGVEQKLDALHESQQQIRRLLLEIVIQQHKFLPTNDATSKEPQKAESTQTTSPQDEKLNKPSADIAIPSCAATSSGEEQIHQVEDAQHSEVEKTLENDWHKCEEKEIDTDSPTAIAEGEVKKAVRPKARAKRGASKSKAKSVDE